MRGLTRRQFLRLSAWAIPAACGVDAALIEPKKLRVTQLQLNRTGTCRFIHFTDLHFKGDREDAAEFVAKVNEQAPDFVCFTGDLIEDKRYVTEALEFVQQIKAPVYGAPGNHDYWSGASFAEYAKAFAATGGAWLVDRSIVLEEHELELSGLGANGVKAVPAAGPYRRVLLMHYPEEANRLAPRRFELILAGHSHGGQVRLPLYGALVLPWGVGPYDLGFYQTPAGPLYVNPGIGTYRVPWRFNCRPEITVVTI